MVIAEVTPNGATIVKPILCALVLATLCASPSTAALIIDQEHDVRSHRGVSNYYLDYPGDYMQQTFTVRNSGMLMGVGVQVSITVNTNTPHPEPIDDLHVRVVRTGTDGFGLPTQVLAEASIVPASLSTTFGGVPGAIIDVDLSTHHAHVVAGERLSIQLSSMQTDNSGPQPGSNYLWFRSLYNPHPGGEYSTFSPKLYGPTPLRDIWLGGGDSTLDAGFRVYVDTIPEPCSLALISFCSATIALVRRRHAGRRD
jgi:hypothetical protein